MQANPKQVRKKRNGKQTTGQRISNAVLNDPRIGLEPELKKLFQSGSDPCDAGYFRALARVYMRWAEQCLKVQAVVDKSNEDLAAIKVWSSRDVRCADLSESSESILDVGLKDVIADQPLDMYPALARQYRLWAVQVEQLHAIHLSRPERLRMTLDPFTTSARAKLPLALAETVAGQDTLFVNELAFMFQDWADKLFGVTKDETDVYLAETMGTTEAVCN